MLVVCAENNPGDVAAAVEAVGEAGGDGSVLEAASRVAVSHGSAWNMASLLAMQGDGGFTVAALDLTTSGHMLVADCHALLKMMQSVFEATLHTVLIKSKALERHARSFHNSHSVLQCGMPWHHICQDVQVICAEGVADYRATIPHILLRDDTVLEIGCGELNVQEPPHHPITRNDLLDYQKHPVS